jgi:hypothetical protein
MPESTNAIPRITGKDCPNGLSADAEPFCNVLGHHFTPQLANFDNVSRSELRGAPPALIHRINYVISLAAQKEVFWIDAYFIVAFVTDLFSFWNTAKRKFPNRPVGKHFSSRPPNLTIAMGRSTPKPTATKFWNVLRDWTAFVYAIPKAISETSFKSENFYLLSFLNRFCPEHFRHVMATAPESPTQL